MTHDQSSRNFRTNSPPHHRFFLLMISTAAFAGCVTSALAGQWITGVQFDAEQLSTHVRHEHTWIAGVLLTLPMFALLYLERRSGIVWLHDLWDMSCEILGPIVARVTLLELVIVSVFAGVGEELLFRGFLQSWLGAHGLLVALVLPNVLFGVLHWISPGYAICTFCIGLYFSCLLQFADSVNLTALMIAHSLYDLVALMFLSHEIRKRHAGQADLSSPDQKQTS